MAATSSGMMQHISADMVDISESHADWGSSASRRHLLRIWLRDEEYGWQIPPIVTESIIWKRLFQRRMEDQWFPLGPHLKIEKFTERLDEQEIKNE
jgi:hypothetical protein